MEFNTYYAMKNKNLLVKLYEVKATLSNGIAVKESRGRKSIITGIVMNAEPSLKIPTKALVWFPAYAMLEIELNEEQYVIVNIDDVIMVERVEDSK